LIESSNYGILGFKKDSINCQIRTDGFSQLIESSNYGILGFKKDLINCQIRTDGFWQLIELFDQLINF
jgi:hypothetical protein